MQNYNHNVNVKQGKVLFAYEYKLELDLACRAFTAGKIVKFFVIDCQLPSPVPSNSRFSFGYEVMILGVARIK